MFHQQHAQWKGRAEEIGRTLRGDGDGGGVREVACRATPPGGGGGEIGAALRAGERPP